MLSYSIVTAKPDEPAHTKQIKERRNGYERPYGYDKRLAGRQDHQIYDPACGNGDFAAIVQCGGSGGSGTVFRQGSNAPVIGLLVNLFVGISLGSNVIIARSIGQRDDEKISKAVHTSVVVALFGGLFLTALGEFLAPEIVKLLEVPADVYPLAVKYLRIYLAGMPVIMLYNFEAAIFRSCGNTRTPLIALVVSGLLNVALNLFLVIGLGMNVDGVATATVIANLVSSVLLFTALRKTKLAVRIVPGKLKVHGDVLGRILKIGIPAGVRLTWIFTVFRQILSFATIMQVYSLSMGITAFVMVLVTLVVKPSRRYGVKSAA